MLDALRLTAVAPSAEASNSGVVAALPARIWPARVITVGMVCATEPPMTLEREESARMDGATLASWNDFMMPSLIIADSAQQTIPVVQNIFQTPFSNNYNVSFASYLMAMAPAIVVYLFTQRWVMEGVTQGADVRTGNSS